MAQWLRGLILSEDLASIPSIQMAAHGCLQLTVLGDMPPLPCFSRHQVCMWHTDVHADKTPVHIKEIQFVKEWAATTGHHMVHFISFFLGTGSSLSLGLMASEPGLGSKLDSVDGRQRHAHRQLLQSSFLNLGSILGAAVSYPTHREGAGSAQTSAAVVWLQHFPDACSQGLWCGAFCSATHWQALGSHSTSSTGANGYKLDLVKAATR